MAELRKCPGCSSEGFITTDIDEEREWVKCTVCSFEARIEDWNARADDDLLDRVKDIFVAIVEPGFIAPERRTYVVVDSIAWLALNELLTELNARKDGTK